MASIFVARGQDKGKTFTLDREVQQIGRDSASHIRLNDSEASRRHARFELRDEEWWIVDLKSSNGTIVNGATIDQVRLSSGDRIEIGGALLIYTAAQRSVAGIDVIVQDTELQGNADASRIVSSIPGSPLTATWQGNLSNKDLLSKDLLSKEFLNRDHRTPRPDDPLGSAAIDADRSLEVMYRTAIAVGRTDDLDELLQRVLRIVFDWVEADRGCVMLKDNETKLLRPAVRCDRDGASEKSLSGPMSISRTILDYVIDRGEGVRTSDARDDARFDSAASIVSGGVREALCVPLQGRYDIVGTLYVDTYSSPGQIVASGNRRRFNDDHLRLITAIGHQAALAIEDTTYYSALLQNERLAAMGQTIATLSHHIKNILQGIRGGSYLIEAGLEKDDTDAVRRGWGIVDRNQDRISNLVMDMLTFSKEREPERTTGSLNETVADVCEMMQTRADELSVTFNCELDASLPMASFDPDAIHRALMNLVTNAVDAAAEAHTARNETAAEGTEVPTAEVSVRTWHNNDTGWVIEVVDNGPGIAPQDREKVFSLFESGKGMRGTGLGLPVSAKIMREHDGTIQIDDRPSGEPGVVFRLVLPSNRSPAGGDDPQETIL